MTWLSVSVSTSKTSARALIKIYTYIYFLCMVTNKKGFGCTRPKNHKLLYKEWGAMRFSHNSDIRLYCIKNPLSLFSLFFLSPLCCHFARLLVESQEGSLWLADRRLPVLKRRSGFGHSSLWAKQNRALVTEAYSTFQQRLTKMEFNHGTGGWTCFAAFVRLCILIWSDSVCANFKSMDSPFVRVYLLICALSFQLVRIIYSVTSALFGCVWTHCQLFMSLMANKVNVQDSHHTWDNWIPIVEQDTWRVLVFPLLQT